MPMTERPSPTFATMACTRQRSSCDLLRHQQPASDIVDNVYWVGFCKENQEGMACTYFENAVFRLRPQAIIVSITSYEARAAGLCERYAELSSWNRTCHGLIEVFDRLYEASCPSMALVPSSFSMVMHSNCSSMLSPHQP
jgi:hypothetical protein